MVIILDLHSSATKFLQLCQVQSGFAELERIMKIVEPDKVGYCQKKMDEEDLWVHTSCRLACVREASSIENGNFFLVINFIKLTFELQLTVNHDLVLYLCPLYYHIYRCILHIDIHFCRTKRK